MIIEFIAPLGFAAMLLSHPGDAIDLAAGSQAVYRYGGYEVLLLHDAYARTPGWWNADGDITLEEFVGLMIVAEAYNELPYARELYIEAAGRQLWMDVSSRGGLPAWCSQANGCQARVYDYLALLVSSAQSRVRTLVRNGDAINPYDVTGYGWAVFRETDNWDLTTQTVMDQARALGQAVLHPDAATLSRWQTYDPHAPYTWGNESMGWDAIYSSRFNSLPSRTPLGPRALVWYRCGHWEPETAHENTACAVMSIAQRNQIVRDP